MIFPAAGRFFLLSVCRLDRVRRSEENSQKGADRGQLIMHKVRILTGSDSPNNQQVYQAAAADVVHGRSRSAQTLAKPSSHWCSGEGSPVTATKYGRESARERAVGIASLREIAGSDTGCNLA